MALVKFREITRAAYNNLKNKEANTQYYITETDGTFSIAFGERDLKGNQPLITGAASTITSSNLTANRALMSNGNGKVAVSAVTSTQLGYLSGVTSSIQTQLNGKAATSHVDGKTDLKSNTDNRAVATTPNDYNAKFDIKGLKTNATLGITGQGSYSALLGIRGWNDSSGGNSHEFALTGDGEVYHRHGATTTWNAWNILAKQSWVTSNTRSNTWMPTAAQVGAVPTSRTVNGKALSSNISLSAGEVGAYTKTEVDNKIAAIPAPDLTPYAKLTGAEFTGDVSMFGHDNYIQYATIGAIAVEDGLSMGYNKIQLLAEPTVNTDAATKKYVDDKVAAGGGSSTKFSKEFWIEAADDTTDLYPYLEANKQYRYTVSVYGDNMGANVVFNNLTSKSFVLMTKAATNTSTVKVPPSYGEGTITLGGNKYTVSVTNVMGQVHVENAVTSLYLRANSYTSASDSFILNIWEV